MDDKTMLEFAAKAYGLTGEVVGAFRVTNSDGSFWYWDPRNDDAHAFRLAVFLEMDLFFGFSWLNDTKGPTATYRHSDRFEESSEDNGDCRFAAARLAVTRAAAEIGKTL